ncbi:Uncharacterised protein [Mycobacteroides abscessus subsp. massiliense]|nr:Uncharacterised protein [Mycobacteroides abscessus subsp. abscessus]SLE06206.1 Uncharacterised protein [Mycobacteroides abscessus subsp. massiliense]
MRWSSTILLPTEISVNLRCVSSIVVTNGESDREESPASCRAVHAEEIAAPAACLASTVALPGRA